MTHQGNHPKQRSDAEKLSVRARLALESALPRGVSYVVVLVGPGFNTFGANMDKVSCVQACEALASELRKDLYTAPRGG